MNRDSKEELEVAHTLLRLSGPILPTRSHIASEAAKMGQDFLNRDRFKDKARLEQAANLQVAADSRAARRDAAQKIDEKHRENAAAAAHLITPADVRKGYYRTELEKARDKENLKKSRAGTSGKTSLRPVATKLLTLVRVSKNVRHFT
jgi:hypothetical protein